MVHIKSIAIEPVWKLKLNISVLLSKNYMCYIINTLNYIVYT
jgi:hypothetical protein